MSKLFCFSLILVSVFCLAQKKVLQTKFSNEKITIDGKIDEAGWNNQPVAKDFITFEPDNGSLVAENRRTEVKVIYNNDAIYIAAILYDEEPNKILKEITQRDDIGTSDFFWRFFKRI